MVEHIVNECQKIIFEIDLIVCSAQGMPKINALSIGRQLQGLRAHCFLNQQTTATVLTSKSVLSRCISMADRTNRTQEDVIHDEKNEEFYIPLKGNVVISKW